MTQIKETWLQDRRGRKFPLKSWIPDKTQFQITIVHGLSQHIDCYEEWALKLVTHGIAVHVYDLAGHGNAQGIRGHIFNFQDYLNQLHLVREKNPHQLKSKPHFLFGHSTGGLVSSLYLQQYPESFAGLILSDRKSVV